NKLLVFDELDESETKLVMRNIDISIAVGITTAGQQIGLFTLGGKLSGDIYTSEDIRIIEIIVPELAVAIKNALSYDEINRFNITLKNEIDEATFNLRQANSKLKELDTLKDEFVSVASHELRTPMTAIKSYLWMALNKSSKTLDPQVKKEITIAYSSTERLLKLVADMLTISRIEGKRLKLQKEEFNFNEISQQAYDELKISAKEKKILFNFDIPAKPILITGDKEKLREVLQNIIGNALKFTPAKGKISFTISEDEKHLDVEVINSGSYIPLKELPKLFQKFNRLNIEATQKENAPVGTGLGLFITKQIVKMHNGSIDVTSDRKEGTTFHIKIPKNS
ncbi:MAG TPA: HAMP domain-containing sensor histidine kinase, partial [Patescibacteria group bacterium]